MWRKGLQPRLALFRESVPGVMSQLKPEGATQVNGQVGGVPGRAAFQEMGTS